MKPEDFGLSMMEQAHRLRYYCMAHSRTHHLDENTMCWLIPIEHKARLFRELEYTTLYQITGESAKLLNIPVRWTINDKPETPELQLVMEPVLSPIER